MLLSDEPDAHPGILRQRQTYNLLIQVAEQQGSQIIAASHSVEQIRAFVGADSLAYLSIEGVLEAIGLPRERFCLACFDGRYPVPVPYDVTAHKFVLEDPPVTTQR